MNILLVTTCYPPINVSGSIRALYYANYMLELGHNVSVLTVDVPSDMSNYDETLFNKISKGIDVTRCDMGFLYKKFYAKKSSDEKVSFVKSEKNTSDSATRLKKLIKDNVAIPDSYYMWSKNAVRKGKEIIVKKNIDYVLSMHETPSSHLVAYRLKKNFPQLKWVAYWSDPWVTDPNRQDYSVFRKYIEGRLEKKVVETADKHLFTTENTQKEYINNYKLKAEDTDIVYRGFDPKMYKLNESDKKPKYIDNDKLNIIHAGEIFTKLRDINPFIESIAYLQEHHKDIYKKINVIFLGGIDNFERVSSKINKLDCIQILPRTGFEEAIKYINYSQLLLLFGNRGSNQIPGKAYDYLGANKCILTILGDANDPVRAMMNHAKSGPILLNKEEEITKTLLNLYAIYQSDKNLSEILSKSNSKFEWKNVVEDLLKKISG
ncbi:hypothetical protein IBT52_12745 [Bacillus sp. S72]|uniref:hypothetical protein n=2 Tax=Bacillus TaxID=1386 RepID=UPI00190DD429|nr:MULTISPECIES: hypothetical protein [unclassified Bacillus (in: firmicutes)]MBJ9983224.1 hypothetical protein [Bacillus sp. S29]MBK0136358.1 hypothetical protein [Bacillus sp. S72]MBK0159408.1 hypothetical protein [Bacillus sp. S71]